MLISQAFPSKYLKADDLNGQRFTLQIMSVTVEDIADGEHKPVMRVVGLEKGIILNKTNGTALAQAFGDDTMSWGNQQIDLLAVPTTFQGRQVMGLVTLPVTNVAPNGPGMPGAAPVRPTAPLAPGVPAVMVGGSTPGVSGTAQPLPGQQAPAQSMDDLDDDIARAEAAAGIVQPGG